MSSDALNTSKAAAIRVVLPAHLLTLARIHGEVELHVAAPVTQRSVLDALEAKFPMLRGTVRDHSTQRRRPFLRFFACEQDLSHEEPDAPLPEAVANGREPFLIVVQSPVASTYDNFFMRWIAPGFANGVGIGLWLKLLAQNRFRIGLPFVGRAAAITASACFNSMAGLAEQLLYGAAVRNAEVQPPLFVLGLARSGTTHLHTLLSQDSRFACPNTFQTMNPRIFLSTEAWLAPCHQAFLPPTRPMDNVRWSVASPAEDEFAIMGLCGLSPFGSWLFPKNCRRYDMYINFSDVSHDERDQWKQSLLHFLKKMQRRCVKPLILKSPFHTARIAILLELFPQAKFVLIHRHPYEVFVSGLHTTRVGVPVSSVQRWDMDALCRRTIDVYRVLLESYFDQRRLIPEGNLVEVGFLELEQSPIQTLRRIYEQLNLPCFSEAEPALAVYLKSIDGYRRNEYVELNADVKSQIAREWNRGFQEWGYEA